MHPVVQLFYLALLTMSMLSIFMIHGMYLVKPLFGITTIDVVTQNAMSDPQSMENKPNEVNALKFLQLMSSLGAFLVPSLLFAFLKFPGGDFLMLKRRMHLSLPVLAILILALSAPFISVLYELNQRLDLPSFLDNVEKMIRDSEETTIRFTEVFLKMPGTSDLIFTLIVMAIIPAIAEELLFRGCIQQVLQEWFKNAHVAIWITAFIFSFIHFQFLGFLPRLMLGGLLGYLFYWSGNLWVPIIAHALNNGGQVLLAYLHEHGAIAFDITSDEPVPAVTVLTATAVCAALIYLFKII